MIVRSPGPAGPAGGGSGGGVTEVTGTAPISVATGTTTPVVSLDADGITTGKIADEAVTNGKIADLTIQTGKIADGAITAAKLADTSVISITGGSLIDVDQATGVVEVSHAPKGATGVATSYPGAITVDSFGHVVATGSTSTPVIPSNNLSDLASAATARTNLGLTIGTTAGDIVALDGSAKLPAVDGSQLTNLPGGGSTDWKRDPTATTVRLFEDLFSPVFPINTTYTYGIQGFLHVGGSGAVVTGGSIAGANGVVKSTFSGLYDRTNFWGPRLFERSDAAAGLEYLFEARVQVDWSTGSGTGSVGVISGFMQDDATAANARPPGTFYTLSRCVGLTLEQDETYLRTFVKDTTSGDTPTLADTTKTSASLASTWFRIAHHAVWNNGTSKWDITHYIDGVSVGTSALSNDTGTALLPYVSATAGGVAIAGTTSVYFDFIQMQYKKLSANTVLNIDNI